MTGPFLCRNRWYWQTNLWNVSHNLGKAHLAVQKGPKQGRAESVPSQVLGTLVDVSLLGRVSGVSDTIISPFQERYHDVAH